METSQVAQRPEVGPECERAVVEDGRGQTAARLIEVEGAKKAVECEIVELRESALGTRREGTRFAWRSDVKRRGDKREGCANGRGVAKQVAATLQEREGKRFSLTTPLDDDDHRPQARPLSQLLAEPVALVDACLRSAQSKATGIYEIRFLAPGVSPPGTTLTNVATAGGVLGHSNAAGAHRTPDGQPRSTARSGACSRSGSSTCRARRS